jgi:hypothetical protein
VVDHRRARVGVDSGHGMAETERRRRLEVQEALLISMTREEHLLIVTMLGRQQLLIKLLIELLRSNGIISSDDLQAFEFVLRQDAASNEALLREVRGVYREMAEGLGLDTGLKPGE